MQIVKSESFGSIKCDFWKDEHGQIWMTREQIGKALGYADPQKAIDNLHSRNKDRLDKFSVILKLRATDGKSYDTRVYSPKGIYEICRWSRQPKADAFYDWVYDVLENLRKGEMLLIPKEKLKEYELEARLKNARVREANILLKIADKPEITSEYRQILYSYASQIIAGKPLLPLPKTEKTYSAGDIARELGVSANKVGRIANQNNLKTPEYGLYVWDKSPYSEKQVQTWRYNEKGRAKLIELIDKKSASTKDNNKSATKNVEYIFP